MLRWAASSEDLQSLVDRFGRAHWIERAVVTPEPFGMELTDLGRERMRQIFTFLEGANRKSFPDDSDIRATDDGKVIIGQLEEVIEDLLPPRLSSTERQILFGLTLVFARQSR